MTESLRGIADIFAFNTTLVRLGITDLSNGHAVHRMRQGEGSSISFLVGHLASSRYGALRLLGVTEENPFEERWGNQQGARDGSDYPDISELVKKWDELAVVFEQALEELSEEQLAASSPTEFPVSDKSVRGALGFLAWHESTHVGQIGLMRTELGYKALQFRFYDHMEARSAGG